MDESGKLIGVIGDEVSNNLIVQSHGALETMRSS